MKPAVYVFQNESLHYKFYEDHPFHPKRLELTHDLLLKLGAMKRENWLCAPKASEADLQTVHLPSYLDAVKALSAEAPDEAAIQLAERYGLTEDTPYFPNMHEVSRSIVGGSIAAAELVMSGQARHALHLGGGLHHALKNRGAGFCVYNDAAVAIARLTERYKAKVLYVDTDVHHGDGVQWAFYTNPAVCTFSIHETGKYLYPGTGAAHERGEAEGFGACFNLPVEPYTEDDSWLESFTRGLEKVVRHFKPDIIVSQHGCDAHALDPLSHVHCSMRIYAEMPRLIRRLAHEWCEGRWVALGGGGYDIWRVVPRAWSLLWLIMSDHPLVRALDDQPGLELPGAWIDAWQPYSPEPLPATWLDNTNAWTPMPRRADIESQNRKMADLALQFID